MCGIAGAWGDDRIGRADLEAALTAILHRGPDEGGRYQQGSLLLGNRRLSIIDLSGGSQPIFNEDGSIAVVFNGEIYNYKELIPELEARGHRFKTRSDTEVLVHLYEEHGTGMCAFLRGMFTFALWDGPRETLFLARDRFGKKPLYYTRLPSGGLLFASEIKALKPLAAAAGQTWSIRDQGVYDFLSIGVVPQPDTLYEGVQVLPPGAWLRCRPGELEIGEYWRLAYTPKWALPYDEVLERIRGLIAEAVRLRLRSDVPLGVFLSGGLDSSIVAWEASREVGATLRTFTIATEDPRLDESPVAARTAKALGVGNTVLRLKVSARESLEQLVRQYDQPFADPSAIPSLEVSRLAREHVKVVLNGDGGDELFGGYRRYLAAWGYDWLRHVPLMLTDPGTRLLEARATERRSRLGFAARFARGLALTPAERYIAWTTDTLLERDKHQIWRAGRTTPTEVGITARLEPGLSALDAQLAADHRLNLLSVLLVKADIATMAHSLEARSPLLDHRLAEFAARLPAAYLLRGGRTKAVLRDAYRGRLSEEVLRGAKRGFEIPLAAWLRGELRPLLNDTVGSPRAQVLNYLDARFVSDLLEERILHNRNRAYIVYALLVLELWLRQNQGAARHA